MTLLISGVFGNEVEIFAADDQGSVHLGRDDFSGQDTTSNRDHTGEGALLVCDTIQSALLFIYASFLGRVQAFVAPATV